MSIYRGMLTVINETNGRGTWVVRYQHIKWELGEYEYVSYTDYEAAVKAFKNIKGQSVYREVKLYELTELIG